MPGRPTRPAETSATSSCDRKPASLAVPRPNAVVLLGHASRGAGTGPSVSRHAAGCLEVPRLLVQPRRLSRPSRIPSQGSQLLALAPV